MRKVPEVYEDSILARRIILFPSFEIESPRGDFASKLNHPHVQKVSNRRLYFDRGREYHGSWSTSVSLLHDYGVDLLRAHV